MFVVRQHEVPSGLDVNQSQVALPGPGTVSLGLQHSAVAGGDLHQFVHVASILKFTLVIEVKVHLTSAGIRRAVEFRLGHEDVGEG